VARCAPLHVQTIPGTEQEPEVTCRAVGFVGGWAGRGVALAAGVAVGVAAGTGVAVAAADA
jgi:hypothetical protein